MYTELILPSINLGKELGMSDSQIIKAIKNGYLDYVNYSLTVYNLNEHIKNVKTKFNQKLYRQIHRNYDNVVVSQLEQCLNTDFYNILFFINTNPIKIGALKSCVHNFLDSINYKKLMNEQLIFAYTTFYTNIFVLEKSLDIIRQNPDFVKILINSMKKFQDIELVVDKTYEMFLEYLNVDDFTKDLYREYILTFFATYNENNVCYNENELNFDFNIQDFNFSVIIDKLIDNKEYNNYDLEKLVFSIYCFKLEDFENLSLALNEMRLIPSYIDKLEKKRLKEELLNAKDNEKYITIADIDIMSGIEFEKFLFGYFTKNGYKCEITKASGDQGIDLIIERGGYKTAVQAKCYSNPVGNHAIMEAIGGMKYYKANRCMVITNSTFTRSAIELAKVNDAVLWDRKILIEKIQK